MCPRHMVRPGKDEMRSRIEECWITVWMDGKSEFTVCFHICEIYIVYLVRIKQLLPNQKLRTHEAFFQLAQGICFPSCISPHSLM